MSDLFHNLIKLCRFSKAETDDKQFPVQQVEYLDKTADAFLIMPYGSHANVPVDFLGLLIQVLNQEQNRVVIPTSPKQRPRLKSGEVIYFHPVTGSKIHFKNNGDIDITAPNINIVGDVNITGDLIVSGQTTLNDLTVSGSATLSGSVTSSGKDISDSHTHKAGTPPGDTGVVN